MSLVLRVKEDTIEVKNIVEWNEKRYKLSSDGTLYVYQIKEYFEAIDGNEQVSDNYMLDDNFELDGEIDDFLKFIFGVDSTISPVPYAQLYLDGTAYVPHLKEVIK